MKNFRNFAIYGLSVGSLSNISAMDLGELLGELLDVLKKDDKKKGLDFLNKKIFNKPANIKELTEKDGVYYQFFPKKQEGEEEKSETLFILFHGLGQSLKEYVGDIETLQNSFNAHVLLIEYNMNGGKTNTFGDMEEYCKNVAKFITENKFNNSESEEDKFSYSKFIFFGYSLGSFVGNLVRKQFNEENKENLANKKITSKYVGYKGIEDLENAAKSFIKTLLKDNNIEISEENIIGTINLTLSLSNVLGHGDKSVNIKNFSDIFKYLLGEEEYNKIKKLTNNALILKNSVNFNKENTVFSEDLKTTDHCIFLASDIDSILTVINNEVNKDKDVFLFQVKGGDEVVGNGMKNTYYIAIGEKVDKEEDKNKKEGEKKEEEKPTIPQNLNNKEVNDLINKLTGSGSEKNIENVPTTDQKGGGCCPSFL